MTGLVGGQMTGSTLDSVIAEMYQEDWYGIDRLETGDFGLGLLHHDDRDPLGHTSWRRGSTAGAVFGSITNRAELGLDDGDLFRRLLDDPHTVLPKLDGPFAVAAVDGDADRAVVATDKLGARPIYYVSSGPFAFGSNVGPLLSLVDDPEIDERGISDMVLIGHVWGEKTLIRQIDFLRSGSVLEYDAGESSVSQYWDHEFTQHPTQTYTEGLGDIFRRTVDRAAAGMDGEVGIWLSGGLDSRALASGLSRHFDPLKTYTYDANPANGTNLEYAASVADQLGAPNVQVPFNPDGLVDVLDRCVRLTDGMLGLVTFANLSAVYNVPSEERSDLILEACGLGGMMGDGIGQTVINQSSTPEEALYRAKHKVDVDTARQLLEIDYDPLETYRAEVDASDQSDFYGTVMDCYYRNYFPRCDFASNPVARSQVGTRIPFADSEFLNYITKMPLEYRYRAMPFTRGKIPYVTSPLKLELVRQLDHGLDAIPYSRSKVAPSRPLWQHGVGFVANTTIDRLRSRPTHGKGLFPVWSRNHDGLRSRLDDLLGAACERPFFDDGAIRKIQRDHMGGEANNTGAISGLATVELWLQQYVDA